MLWISLLTHTVLPSPLVCTLTAQLMTALDALPGVAGVLSPGVPSTLGSGPLFGRLPCALILLAY